MFIDEAQITVKAGRGGDGAVSFRREKYEPRGGPNGGDGGDGGDVILQVKRDMRTLLDFQYRSIFKADKGRQGTSKKRRGKNGANCIVPVPPGTTVYDLDLDQVAADLVAPGQSLSADELTAYTKERLAAYKYPRIIEFSDGLPKGPTGKILKRELK